MLRYTQWVDLAVTLCRSPCTKFPRAALADQLYDTYRCSVSWNWLNSDGSFGFEVREPMHGFPPEEEAARWSSEGFPNHPLLRWYAVSEETAPMSIGRVPHQIAPRLEFVREMLAPHGLEQQLAIPYRMGTGTHRAFVLARPGDDFPDELLDVARFIQPLIIMLDRQATTLARAGDNPGDLDLTGRELAVLQLLREGLTAVAIGHRLLISPRTVHTHLRSIYRKLGVADRMQAVLLAQELGLLPLASSDKTPALNGLPTRWTSPAPALPTSPVIAPSRSAATSVSLTDLRLISPGPPSPGPPAAPPDGKWAPSLLRQIPRSSRSGPGCRSICSTGKRWNTRVELANTIFEY